VIKLHDYQEECIDVIHETFKESDKQLVQLPTGSGKTFIFLNYLKRYGKKAIITCPSRDLLNQIYEWGKFFLGDRISIRPRQENKDFFVVTAASLNFELSCKALLEHKVDFIIIDEAHHAQSQTYERFLERYSKNHEFKLLGFTATPERMDRKSLDEIFGQISFSRNIYEMIEAGYLCDMKGWRIKTGCELESITKAGGDFVHHSIKKLDIESRNNLILNTYKNHCQDRKTLIFCIDIEHSIRIDSSLKMAGFRSSCIHGRMPINERKKIIEDFKTGKLHVLTNCQLLTEGFDEPSIDALIIARPTRSKALYCQMIGRGLRIHPGKEFCHLYELTDNNHNICNFNTATDNEVSLIVDYQPGIKLSDLKKKADGLSIETMIIKKEEFDVFKSNSVLDSWFNETNALDSQLELLGRNLPSPPSALEAAFIIWKENLRRKYGSHSHG
jgi:superfamily II DNA or RNA helicase